MEPEIRLHLFNNRPRVELNGVDLHIQDSSLDLFVYLAVENQAEYDRDELVQRLYESLDLKDNFRKAALGGLNKEIKSICTIYPAPHNMLGYDGSHVRVDVLEFANLAKRASEVNSLTAYKLIAPQLLEAYHLYQDDFLNGYAPALYGLGRWIEEKQAALRELFHRLLERLVQYEILDNQYDLALAHAEHWHRSLPKAELPLQYLIWLATNLDSYSMTLSYFNKLNELDSANLRVIGYSPEEWRRLLARGIKPDIAVLQLNNIARIEVHDLLELTPHDLVGRDKDLEEIFEILFVTRDHTLLTVTGARGIGKTALAEAVATACLKTNTVNRIIRVGVTSESDFDQILNTIALQVDMPHLLDLNYRNKFLSVEQLFESETDLLILDQQEVGDVFTEEFKARIVAFSEHVRILVCCHDAWDNVHNVLLGPLDLTAQNTLFASALNPQDEVTEADGLLAATGGSPFAIKLLMCGLQTHRLSLREAFAQIREFSAARAEDEAFRYKQVLRWCWHLLDPQARRVLASFREFDLLEGPGLAELLSLHPDKPDDAIVDALKQLSSMALIELVDDRDPPHYRWHSLLHDFLWEGDSLAQTIDNPDFQSQIRVRFCNLYLDYLTQYADEYPRLDARQHNLLHAFDLGFEQGVGTLTPVNRFVPYLIARGGYRQARRLLEQAAQIVTRTDSADHIELLLNAANLDIKQGEHQAAEQRLNEALAQAHDRGHAAHLGEIYHQLGNILKFQGRYEQSANLLGTALDHAQKTQDSKLICTILANLGVTAVEHGDYDVAKGYFKESLEAAQTDQQQQIIEFAYTSLGVIAIEQLDFELALKYLAEAQTLTQQIGSPERQAYIYLNTSAACYNLKRYSDAQVNLENGLEIAQKLRHEELVANFTRMSGRIEAVKEHLLKAEHDYKQALMTALDRGFTRLAADILLDLGKISFQRRNGNYTYRCFREALAQALELRNYDLVAEALFGLGITTAAEMWIVGPDDDRKTIQALNETWDAQLLAQLPGLPITLELLRKAEFYFQQGLVNFPEIRRYRVAEALASLVGGEG